jgi:hypothetical protein
LGLFYRLTPPFIDPSRPLPSQLIVLLSVILSLEFVDLRHGR